MIALPDLVCTFSSGSKGNCAYFRLDGVELLIDAGISCRRIQSGLALSETSPASLDAILITHEHTDHTNGLALITHHTSSPVYYPEACEGFINVTRGERRPLTVKRTAGSERFAVGSLEVEAFGTPHDSRGSVGYVIRSSRHTVGYCTDLGEVSPRIYEELRPCDSLVLESNHDLEMLEEGPYPRDLKDRIRSRHGHLSNDDCAATVAQLAEGGLQRVLLAHLSEINNRPELAYAACRDAVGDGVEIGVAGVGVTVRLIG